MLAAQLQNNVVINLIEVAELDVLPDLLDGTGAVIGATWDGAAWHLPTEPDPTPEQARAAFKAARAAAVAAIVVTIDGLPFDGDETSQERMSRAVLALQLSGESSTQWMLANNQEATVTMRQLGQALVAAGREQTRIWMS